MELRDYLELLRRRWVVVLLPVLGAVALAVGLSLLSPPGYQSTTTLFYAPRDPTQGTSLATQRLASYVELVSGPRLARGVAQQLALPQDDATVQNLAERLSAKAQPESLLVTITATGKNPQDAQRVAQAAASQLVQLAASLEPPAATTQSSPVWLTVAEPAQPGVPLGRGTLVQEVVLAVVLGLALGIAAAFLVEALDTRVVDARGLRRVVPGAVLSLVVPRGQRDGAEPPAPSLGVVRVLRTTLLGQALPHSSHAPRVVVVTGSGPGGATGTVAAWIAVALRRSGSKVLLLRADDQSVWEPGAPPGVAQALAGQVELDALPLRTLDGGPWVLRLGHGVPEPGEVLAAPGMPALVRRLADRFDHLVIDAPPVIPYLETAMLAGACADQVALVVQPGWARRRQVRAATAVLAQHHAPFTLSVLARSRRRDRTADSPAVTELPPLTSHVGAFPPLNGVEAPAALPQEVHDMIDLDRVEEGHRTLAQGALNDHGHLLGRPADSALDGLQRVTGGEGPQEVGETVPGDGQEPDVPGAESDVADDEEEDHAAQPVDADHQVPATEESGAEPACEGPEATHGGPARPEPS